MKPGPIYIYQCPNCDKLMSQWSILSGNTFGATLYSDGKMIAPMLSELPRISKCKKCGFFTWLNKLEPIGSYNIGEETHKSAKGTEGKTILPQVKRYLEMLKPGLSHDLGRETSEPAKEISEPAEETNVNWGSAEEVEFPDIKDYFKAIDQGLAENKDEELYIRQHIWWSFNDRVRNGEEIFNDEKDKSLWYANIQRLKALFDKSDDNQIIMIAEIHRNLGDFENCMRLIRGIENDEFNWVKEKFHNACKQKNKVVIELK